MPKRLRNLRVTFGAKTLTHSSGINHGHRSLVRFGLKHAIAHDIHVVQRNNCYSIDEMIPAALYPMILDLERIETTQPLGQNGVHQDFFLK